MAKKTICDECGKELTPSEKSLFSDCTHLYTLTSQCSERAYEIEVQSLTYDLCCDCAMQVLRGAWNKVHGGHPANRMG